MILAAALFLLLGFAELAVVEFGAVVVEVAEQHRLVSGGGEGGEEDQGEESGEAEKTHGGLLG